MSVQSTRKPVVLVAAIALLVGLLVPGAVAQTPACGPFVPTSQVTRGMVGQGLTVVQGDTPQPFTVEVLGVLRGGIAPGRDMIVVEVDAPFIDEAGGIWFGMSGSPVYVGDRLLGAVAFGLAFSPSTIGGLTPAEDMMDLFDLPSGSFSADRGDRFVDADDQVEIQGELAAEIRRRVGGDRPAFTQSGVTMRRLPLPLSVSGLSDDRLDLLQETVGARGLSVTAHAGTAMPFTQATSPPPPPGPGQNLAAALSVGDLTIAGVGTATAECDGQLVGFGHPFTFRGGATSGAATADAITIVPDPTFGPYKLANVEALFGTVDQDRLAGLRAIDGVVPEGTRVLARVTDSDLQRSRTGRTDVLEPDAVPDLAAFHLLANIDSLIDRIGEGTAAVTFTAVGTGSRSGAFELRRGNVHASEFDIAFESIIEMLGHLFALRSFSGEDVTIDGVSVEATIEQEVALYDLAAIRVGVDGAPPEPLVGPELFVRPGAVLDIEVDLRGIGDGLERTAALQVQVPDDAYGFGFLDVVGGSQPFFFDCLFDPALCGATGAAETVQELADELAAVQRNDEVGATLVVPTLSGEDPGPFPPGGSPTPEPAPSVEPSPPPPPPSSVSGGTGFAADPGRRSGFSGEAADGPRYAQFGPPVVDRDRVDRVVRGGLSIGVLVDAPYCPDCPPVFNRLAGEDRTGTAAAIAGAVHGVADTIVLAPAHDYPHALVAGPLATREGAPVLLTRDGALSPATGAAIRQLGATRVIIVAPDGQLGTVVEDDLRAAGVSVIERIGGADRYAVAGAVAARLGGHRVWLVEGEHADPARGWPDAVSAAAIAGYEDVPILLTRAEAIPAATATALTDLGTTDVSIAGGTAAVSSAVEDDLVGRGIAVERVAGASRDETAYLLAQRAIELGAFRQTTWVVTAGNYPDALAAAPAVVATGGVMIMADGTDVHRTPGAVRHFSDLRFTAPFITFVGGVAAISQDVEGQVFDILVAQAEEG